MSDQEPVRRQKIRADGWVRCSKCDAYHPREAFSHFASGKPAAWCKPCMAEYVRGYRQRQRAAVAS